MARLASWHGLACLFLAFVIGSGKMETCNPESSGSCPTADQTTLLQSRVGVIEALVEADNVESGRGGGLQPKEIGEDPSNQWIPQGEEEDAEVAEGMKDAHIHFQEALEAAEVPGDDDSDDAGSSGSGATDSSCSSFTTGSTCRSSGCSWSGAFVGEKKEDGSELTGYICADDEEVEEELHDKLVNGTGSLIQMLEDESEITSKGNDARWCRRRRAGGGSCPYCRRRRSPPPAAKIEANGCPTGLKANPNGKCPGSGKCCTAGWTAGCSQACVQQRCSSTGGSWIPLNYASNAYTCEMPKSTKASKYCDEPNGDDAGFDCLCAAGTGFCGAANTWVGPLDAAKTKCDGSAECKYLHDWKADGNNWRACRKITSPGDGKAAIKKKSSSDTCTNQAYFETAFGSSTCPSGFEKITDQVTCQKARAALNKGQWEVKSWWNIQPGCFSHSNNRIWFNTNGAGRTHKAFSSICKRTVAPATQAPSPTKKSTVSPTRKALFDSVDGNGNQGISRAELQKALDAGKIIKGSAAPPAKPPATVAPTTKAPSSGGLTQSQKDAIVKKHNALRAGLGASDMTKMTWDDTLANAAQQYVSGVSLLAQQTNVSSQKSQKCPRGHSQNRANSVGENMAWKWSSSFQLADIVNTDFTPSVQSWYDEIKDAGPYKTGGRFDGFGKCSGVCGHYTQVVWAAANKIGCGAAYCPHSTGMGGYELVCQYGTTVSGGYGGNMGGATVFTSGTACSKCPSGFGTCSSNLCT